MSVSPVKPAPVAPYVEDCDDSQDEGKPVSAGPPVANTARKVTRRDEASDSGYSSHTYATGSSSQSSRKKPPEPKKAAEPKSGGGFFSKFGMGKKTAQSTAKKREEKAAEKTADKPESPKAVRRHSLGRSSRNQNLRAAATAVAETNDAAVKKRPVVAPMETKLVRTESAHTTAPANIPRASPVVAYGPQPISVPLANQRPHLYAPIGRQRPYSYHGGSLPTYGPLGAPYYPDAPPMPPVVMPPGVHPYPPPGPAQHPYAVLQPSSPTSRIINYNMPHTSPHMYIPPSAPTWGGNHGPPPAMRRVSMSAATHGPIVQYPRVPPSHYGLQRSYTNGYTTPLESPEEYDTAFYTQDDESYYRDIERRERDRRSMPPPPLPQRPGIGRAATASARTMTLPRNKRLSLEPPTSSQRMPSIEDNSRAASRPNPTKRSSQSSAHSGEPAPTAGAVAPTPPSPTLRRQSRGLSRPTSYHENHDKYQAAEEYQERTGVDPQPAITADAVHKVLREKPETKQSRGTRSTRSQSSRTSSKSSDPKRQQRPAASAEKSRDRNALDAMAIKLGRMVMDAAGDRPFAVRQHDGDVEIRVKSAAQSRSRDGRSGGKERTAKYVPSGSTNSRSERGEVEVHRSRTHRSGEEGERSNSARHRSRSHVRRRPADEGSAVVDGDPIDRVRSKAESNRESHSRRSSRSGASSRRPVLREEA
jgi:hypothetical protein